MWVTWANDTVYTAKKMTKFNIKNTLHGAAKYDHKGCPVNSWHSWTQAWYSSEFWLWFKTISNKMRIWPDSVPQ